MSALATSLRGEIRGAFQESGLPEIRRDLSALRADVQDLRQDLQLLARLPRHTLGGRGAECGDPAPAGFGAAGAPPGRRAFASGAAKVQPESLEDQLASPHYIESEDEIHESIGKKQGEALREWPPAPVALTRPTTPGDPEPSLPVTPPALAAASRQAAAAQRSREAERELAGFLKGGRRTGSWIQDPPQTATTDRDSSVSQASDDMTPTTRRKKTQDRSTNFQERSAYMNFRSQATQNLDGIIVPKPGQKQGKSLANLRISRAVKAPRKRKQTLIEWTKTLAIADTWRDFSAAAVLTSFRFDNAISFLILANSVTIGLEADYAARHITENVPWYYRAFEIFFCVVFTSELALRVWVYKRSFFWKRDIGILWNYFDLVVVGAQLVQEIVEFMKSSSDDGNAGNLRILRILRVLRIVRIFRLVRVLHLISELRTIVSSIMGSFRSLFWTVILLLLMMYIVGVWFLQSVTDHFLAKGSDFIPSTGEDKLREHFHSLGQTILSLWQALSGGVDWGDVADPLMSEVEPLLGVAFAAFIAFAILALMNVVTGVFVQTALHSAEQEEETFLTDQIIALFHKCKGGDDWGCITERDLELRLADPDMAKEWKNINVSADEATYVFALLDVDGNGEVQFEEFLSACLRLRGSAKSLDMLIQLQESRHAKKVLEDMIIGIQENVKMIADSLPNSQDIGDKVTTRTTAMIRQILQKEAFRPPKQPDTHLEIMTPSTSDDEV